MCRCAFCGESVKYDGGFVLCEDCRGQLCALSAQDAGYMWFAGALKRAIRSMRKNGCGRKI